MTAEKEMSPTLTVEAPVKDRLKEIIEKELIQTTPTIENARTIHSLVSHVLEVEEKALAGDELTSMGADIDEELRQFTERLVALRG